MIGRRINTLTPAERRVFELAITPLTRKEIGEKLYMSIGTVKFHLGHIYKKLGFYEHGGRHRLELVQKFGACSKQGAKIQ